MGSKRVKVLLAVAFSTIMLFFCNASIAQPTPEKTASPREEQLDPSKIIMDHVKDAHEFHFFEMGNFHATIPLPVILYSPTKGFSVFSSARFGVDGEAAYNGYKFDEDKNIISIDGAAVYDFSLTKNVVQMFIALSILVLLMTGIAKKYKTGQGVTSAPTGFQNAIEPVITFVRDEVAKPSLGSKAFKYLPYLLTVFFFILINNIFGLLPGSANVTGNIAFTLVLATVSLLVILFSSNGHFWGHIFWAPGIPIYIRPILIPIEFAGIFIKPVALMIRLFANMIAGHIIILSFIVLIFIFGAMSNMAGYGFSPLSVAFAVFIYCIEILVAFIQAFIFTNLTAIFIGQALENGHGDAMGGHNDSIIA